MKSKYFQALADVTNEKILKLSERLCKRHQQYSVWHGVSYFPNHHATGGDTPLRLTERVKLALWQEWDEWWD